MSVRPAKQRKHEPETGIVRRLLPWVLSLLAILLAKQLEHTRIFERISLVVSDYVSQLIGTGVAKHVVLIRVQRTFSQAEWTELLSRAIPSLVMDYHAAAAGVDIDFSGQNFENLARAISDAEKKNPVLAHKLIWAVGHQQTAGESAESPSSLEDAMCDDCSNTSCKTRFTPNPVFGAGEEPGNYALAMAFPDSDSLNRSSVRFACHSMTQLPVPTFHFKLVEEYCHDHQSELVSCRELRPNEQARTWIHTWYSTAPIDLCSLVRCSGKPGAAIAPLSNDLAGKVVILYSDVSGNDDHATMVGVEKGAKIVAALVENDLQFGAVARWPSTALKYILEAGITVLLIVVFHYRRTQRWAILIAIAVFVGYLYVVPFLARWAPDFRHYVLAISAAFTLELALKSAWRNLELQR